MVGSTSIEAKHISIFKTILSVDLNSSQVSVYLASANKNDLAPNFERVLMAQTLTDGFRDILKNTLKKYKKEIGNNNTLFPEYFIESILEENEIEYFEIATRDTIAKQIEPLDLITDIEIFSEESDFIKNICFYVIVAQPDNSDPIYFYHFYTPKKILKRAGLLAVLGTKGEYNRIDDHYIYFEETIDCISYNGFMFIFNKNNFQAMFRFLEEVRATAQETLDTINCQLPIQNFNEFMEACNGNITMLRKLKKIAAKPYIKDLKMSDVRKIIEENHLPVQIIEVEGQEKILFDPQAKAKEKYALLRIFNDDYLKSLMTGKDYEVTGKREL